MAKQTAKQAAAKQAKARGPRYEVYQDAAGQWRWRLRASNGKVIADGGEGYKRKRDVLAGVKLVQATGACTEVRELEPAAC